MKPTSFSKAANHKPHCVVLASFLQFTILTEAPAFQFQSVLLSKVPVRIVMHVSMVLLSLRLGCYALLPFSPTPWAVLPVELLHGEGPGCDPVDALCFDCDAKCWRILGLAWVALTNPGARWSTE